MSTLIILRTIMNSSFPPSHVLLSPLSHISVCHYHTLFLWVHSLYSTIPIFIFAPSLHCLARLFFVFFLSVLHQNFNWISAYASTYIYFPLFPQASTSVFFFSVFPSWNTKMKDLIGFWRLIWRKWCLCPYVGQQMGIGNETRENRATYTSSIHNWRKQKPWKGKYEEHGGRWAVFYPAVD